MLPEMSLSTAGLPAFPSSAVAAAGIAFQQQPAMPLVASCLQNHATCRFTHNAALSMPLSPLSSTSPRLQSGLGFLAQTASSTSLTLLRGGALRGGAASNPNLNLDRVAFRLEGMEIYSLVMALFMGAALTLLGGTPSKIHSWKEMRESKSKFVESVASYAFYAFCTYSVISSGFTTILFTLTSLYCKTAVGMGSDSRYLAFLEATGHIRAFGFFAFMRSITTFGISFILSTFLNCSGMTRWTVPLIPTIATFIYWGKLKTLVDVASTIIFAPPS